MKSAQASHSLKAPPPLPARTPLQAPPPLPASTQLQVGTATVKYADLSISALLSRKHQDWRALPPNHGQVNMGSIGYVDIRTPRFKPIAASQLPPTNSEQMPVAVNDCTIHSGENTDLPEPPLLPSESIQAPPIPARTYRRNLLYPSIDEKITKLEEEYVEIESLVLEAIGMENIPVKKMLRWVQVLPMTLKAQFSELLRTQAKAMSTASNTDELFFILSQYWNSLHPSLLEHIVSKLQNASLKERMSGYMNDLRTFRSCTSLGEFVDKWVGRVPPGLDEFIMELGEEWKGRTMNDLEQFRLQLSRQKCFSGQMPYMKKAVSGSILVVFGISSSIFPLNFKRPAIRSLLQEYHILRVTVKGNCILDMVCYGRLELL